MTGGELRGDKSETSERQDTTDRVKGLNDKKRSLPV